MKNALAAGQVHVTQLATTLRLKRWHGAILAVVGLVGVWWVANGTHRAIALLTTLMAIRGQMSDHEVDDVARTMRPVTRTVQRQVGALRHGAWETFEASPVGKTLLGRGAEVDWDRTMEGGVRQLFGVGIGGAGTTTMMTPMSTNTPSSLGKKRE